MTLTESIKNEPYLKISNCTDYNDCETAINICKQLEVKYGQSKTLDKIWIALINKSKKFK